jgi:hypothetical protein
MREVAAIGGSGWERLPDRDPVTGLDGTVRQVSAR